MPRRGERDRDKERFWRSILRQYRRSGLSVRDFCAEHHLAEANFYAWRRTIARRDQQALRQPHEDRHDSDHGQPDFVPLRLADAVAPHPLAQPATLEVMVAGQRLVRVPAGFDAATLRQLLAVLAETSPC